MRVNAVATAPPYPCGILGVCRDLSVGGQHRDIADNNRARRDTREVSQQTDPRVALEAAHRTTRSFYAKRERIPVCMDPRPMRGDGRVRAEDATARHAHDTVGISATAPAWIPSVRRGCDCPTKE